MKFFALGVMFILLGAVWAALPLLNNSPTAINPPSPRVSFPSLQPKSSITPEVAVKTLPNNYVIPFRKQIFQTFNNCGPASLSMALAYFGVDISQAEIGEALRPYQIPHGDNDDKSVTFDELGEYATKFGLVYFHRPNGSIELLKKLVSNNIPVLTRTLLHKTDDIGHYRLVRGFDDQTQEFIQDDSFENRNLRFKYMDFGELWRVYNYEYLVLVPPEKMPLARAILGSEVDAQVAWKNALIAAQNEAAQNPNNPYFVFNQSVAQYYLGNYAESIRLFEQVQNQLSFRTLWYQIEPILAYQKLKQYDKVFALTEEILNNHNRAFSELYIIRGEIYLDQGNKAAARAEFEKAVFYNKNLQRAQELLDSVS